MMERYALIGGTVIVTVHIHYHYNHHNYHHYHYHLHHHHHNHHHDHDHGKVRLNRGHSDSNGSSHQQSSWQPGNAGKIIIIHLGQKFKIAKCSPSYFGEISNSLAFHQSQSNIHLSEICNNSTLNWFYKSVFDNFAHHICTHVLLNMH